MGKGGADGRFGDPTPIHTTDSRTWTMLGCDSAELMAASMMAIFSRFSAPLISCGRDDVTHITQPNAPKSNVSMVDTGSQTSDITHQVIHKVTTAAREGGICCGHECVYTWGRCITLTATGDPRQRPRKTQPN